MPKILLRDDHHRETTAEALESYLSIVDAVKSETEDGNAVLKEHTDVKNRDIKVLREIIAELRARSN